MCGDVAVIIQPDTEVREMRVEASIHLEFLHEIAKIFVEDVVVAANHELVRFALQFTLNNMNSFFLAHRSCLQLFVDGLSTTAVPASDQSPLLFPARLFGLATSVSRKVSFVQTETTNSPSPSVP